jgi:AdoMet-dependent heme synthase
MIRPEEDKSRSTRILSAPFPRLVAMELTRKCNLNCIQCRAFAEFKEYHDELSTEEVKRIFREINELGKSIIILTGGEPLMRNDIYDIASYGSSLGLRMVLATNGTLNTPDVIKKMKDAGIARISISIDGSNAKTHDMIRGEEGAFDGAVNGTRVAIENGMPVQINTTITQHNVSEIEGILKLVRDLKASSLHVFLLVPTGRGKELADQAIPPAKYEEVLHWLANQKDKFEIEVRTTCAPHYYRVIKQLKLDEMKVAQHPPMPIHGSGQHPFSSMTRGCLAGVGFAFISHVGKVQTCGYLDIECGDLRKSSFIDVWKNSPEFTKLRNLDNYKGKCGICEYAKICGGCRARAYAATGDYLDEEPYCIYIPTRLKHSKQAISE